VFKLAKTQKPSTGRQYIFNNSFAVRRDYIRKGTLRGLRHYANAVRYCRAGEGVCDAKARFFGDLAQPQGSTDERFTTEWARWNIEFGDDVILHPQYTKSLEQAGYGPFAGALAIDPGFRNPLAPGSEAEGLRLSPDSVCWGRASARTVDLPDGSRAELPGGRDVGAFQGMDLFRWREFTPLAPLVT